MPRQAASPPRPPDAGSTRFWASLTERMPRLRLSLENLRDARGQPWRVRSVLGPGGHKTFEITEKIDLPPVDGMTRYSIETWFFLPTSLQINRVNYAIGDFPDMLKNHIRLRAPAVDLAGLAAAAPASLLGRMDATGRATADGGPLAAHEEAVKLYGLSYRHALRLALDRAATVPPEARAAAVAEVCAHARAARAAWHEHAAALPPGRVRETPVHAYTEEFLWLVTALQMHECQAQLAAGEPARDALGREIAAVVAHCRDHFPESLAPPDAPAGRASYRWSVLQKYMAMPLYLDIHPHDGQSWIAHTAAALAAAVAMILATAIAFVWQGRYGSLSAPVFAALVIGYMFKDRIKESVRLRLFRLLRHWLPDQRMDISRGDGRSVGRSHEIYQFLQAGQVPQAIHRLRSRTPFVDVDNAFRSEDILYYAKTVTLRNTGELFLAPERSMMDIASFEISDFLRHADDVRQTIVAAAPPYFVRDEKIYHINVLRRVTHRDQVSLERLRLTVSRSGIREIEELTPLGQDGDGDAAPR